MDPFERVTLQAAVSKLAVAARADDAVSQVLVKAQTALDGRDWGAAKALYHEALDAFKPSVSVAHIILRSGHVKTLAMANRLISMGKVKVDGVVLRKQDTAWQEGQTISVSGKPLDI